MCVLSATKNIWLKQLTQKKIKFVDNDDLQGMNVEDQKYSSNNMALRCYDWISS